MRLLLPATAPAVGIAGAECMVPAQKRADISFMTLDITSSWVSKTVRVDPTERITQYATFPTPFSLSANLLHWQRETHSPDAPWALLWNRSSFHMILDADCFISDADCFISDAVCFICDAVCFICDCMTSN